MSCSRSLGMFAAALLSTVSIPAHAAELRVISAGAVRGVVGGMIDDYSKSTGHRFDFTTGPTGFLRDAIASGKSADLIIASSPLMGELEKTGKMMPGSRVEIGRIGLGVVIREGAPAPKLETPEDLKQALVQAKSIAYTDPKLGGVSVVHLMKISEGFGIRDEVTRKGVPATGGNDAAAKVANGEAEIAIVLISEIGAAKGAKLAAPLPGPTQLWMDYSAAIPASSTDPGNAKALASALTSPSMRPRWIAAGWEPAR